MRKSIGRMSIGLFAISAFVWAQASPPSPPPNQQLSLEFLANVLRTASSFHDMVKSMNIQGNLSSPPALNPDGSPAAMRPINRTAAIMGAGAGAGAALGELTGSQKGLMVGIIAGTAGALVLDQVLRHREEKLQAAPDVPQNEVNRKLMDRPAPPQAQH